MVANILIAGSFFLLGLIVGGVLVVRSAWNEFEKKNKELRESQSNPLIIRVYEAKW